MKKLQWLALLVIILLILSNFLSWFGGNLIGKVYGPKYVGIEYAHLRDG